MNVLVVPMFALSRMGGPWSRAQAVAAAFQRAGHHVILGVSQDGNCPDPCVPDTLELPVPSPLGAPMFIASRTFPLAEKLGISGRKPVRSFEEVLWLTGALAYRYERESVEVIRCAIAEQHIDVVYSEYSLPAIIAARVAGVPVFGSFSYTTQVFYASAPAKAGGVRKLLGELGLPATDSALELFGWLERRFVPSCRTLEPIEGSGAEFVGFLRQGAGMSSETLLAPGTRAAAEEPQTTASSPLPDSEAVARDCVVVYLGAGSVPQSTIEKVVVDAFGDTETDVFVAGAQNERTVGRIHFAPRFDFSELLPRACCFVHHGGQNSTMDALAYGAPQVIVPGRVFERIYNAESIQQAGAGLRMDSFEATTLAGACSRVASEPSFAEAACALRIELASLGGADAIVKTIEAYS